MDRDGQSIPWLSPEELANPQTRVTINEIEWELWQVGQLYGVSHALPSPMLRTGASARDVRERYSRVRHQETDSAGRVGHTSVNSVPDGQPWPDSPTLPSSIPAQRQYSTTREMDGRGLSSHELLRLVDEAVDDAWFEEEGEEDSTIEPATTPFTTPSNFGLAHWRPSPSDPTPIYVDPSFPPPRQPPPNRPLPRVPAPAASARHPVEGAGLNLEIATELTGYSAADPDVDWTSERTNTPTTARVATQAGSSDSGSERTITPAISHQQLLVDLQEQSGIPAASR
jgi:hypothetical protein